MIHLAVFFGGERMLLGPGMHERLQPLQLPHLPCVALPDSELPVNPAAWLKKNESAFCLQDILYF